MKIRFFSILIIVLIISQLSSCNKKERVLIGYSIEAFGSGRWQKEQVIFTQKVKQAGGDVIVKNSDGDASKQYKQCLDLFNKGIDVLVIAASNVNTAAAIVREAHKHNVKVIAYSRLIKNCDLDYFVGINTEEIGRLQAEYALKKVPKGNYVLIEGDKNDENAVVVAKTHDKILKTAVEKGDINIIYKVFVDEWLPANAAYEMQRVISYSTQNIDAVIVANDGMAGDVIKILELNGLNKVLTTGLDAELSAIRRIAQGKQTMTVKMQTDKLAEIAANLAVDIANGKKADFDFVTVFNGSNNVAAVLVGSTVIDKNNLQKEIIETGIYTKEQIFGNKN